MDINDVNQIINEAKVSILLIDVRTKEEYAQGHLPKAKNIPMDEKEKILGLAKKEDPIILYCRSGHRSGIVQQYLKEQGYTNVENAGGILDYKGESI